MYIDKDELKFNLEIEQVQEYIDELGAESIKKDNNVLICKTICHCGESHKLYYYHNTHLFKCYTDCPEESFDIFELTKKIKTDYSLFQAISYVAEYFGFSSIASDNTLKEQLKDWKILEKYNKINQENQKQQIEFKHYDKKILTFLPKPHILPWEKEGIKKEIMDQRGIAYNPVSNGIIIPHYDIDNYLIGIRERTLIKDQENYGKYRPSILNGQMYNHPLGFNLYNLNNSKENIKIMKKAIVYEGEKSPLLFASYFGVENDISVACCGSSLISYQVNLLLSLGVEEIIIAFDKQFKKIKDEEWQKWTNKLEKIYDKYGSIVKISFIFDKENLLEYKMSPIDNGPEVFLKLFKNRIYL